MTNYPKNVPKRGRQGEIKFGVKSAKGMLASPNYMGACFQAPSAHTWTETNGNIHRFMCLSYSDHVLDTGCLTILSFHHYPCWHCLPFITKCPTHLDWCAGCSETSSLELLTILYPRKNDVLAMEMYKKVLGVEIIWVHVPRLLKPHPDRD